MIINFLNDSHICKKYKSPAKKLLAVVEFKSKVEQIITAHSETIQALKRNTHKF